MKEYILASPQKRFNYTLYKQPIFIFLLLLNLLLFLLILYLVFSKYNSIPNITPFFYNYATNNYELFDKKFLFLLPTLSFSYLIVQNLMNFKLPEERHFFINFISGVFSVINIFFILFLTYTISTSV